MLWWRRKEILEYQNRLANLKTSGLAAGLSDEEINQTFNLSLKYIKEHSRNQDQWKSKKFKWFLLITLVIGLAYFGQFYKPFHNLVERNIQDVIYPFMTFYRRLTLPLVQIFPFLTEFYDESCLLENPYFQVTDMECWPCENARVVLNLTEAINKAHVGLPFLIVSLQVPIKYSELRDAYFLHKAVIDDNAGRISSNLGWNHIKDVLVHADIFIEHPNAHTVWRINRMETGRVLRAILKPPLESEVPPHASSLGIERFLMIDGPSAGHYTLPSTEGANVFVKQLAGQRLIVLEPAPDCRGKCRRLSVVLNESQILWYNWWYWRPRSLPIQNSTSISITFIGSTV